MKKTIILIFTLVIIYTIGLISFLEYKEKSKEIIIGKDNINGMISVMVENNKGDYEKSKSNTWPEGYILNESLSKCENGSKLTWNSQDKSIKVSTNRTDKCYVYLDKLKTYTLLTNENINIENQDAILTNLIGDGSFEKGLEWWTITGIYQFIPAIITHGEKVLKIPNQNDIDISTIIKKENFIEPISNHKYYSRLMILSNDNYSVLDSRYIWNDYSLLLYLNKKTNTWSLLSNIVSNTDVKSEGILQFFVRKSNDDVYFDEFMLIDITDSYKDNMPSKDWLDKNLMYFDGTVNIKTIEAGDKATFKINNFVSGNISCNNGAIGSINSDNTVTIKGSSSNNTCIIE